MLKSPSIYLIPEIEQDDSFCLARTKLQSIAAAQRHTTEPLLTDNENVHADFIQPNSESITNLFKC